LKETENFNIKSGIAAAPGLTIARAYIFSKEKEVVNDSFIVDPDEAIRDLEEALEKSRKELEKVLAVTIDILGKNRGLIFEAQIMILDDPFLIGNIKKRIAEEKRNPEFTVDTEFSKYQKIMARSEQPYMKERILDIEDIKNRIIKNIRKKKWVSRLSNDIIVISEFLTPADTVLFLKNNVQGYVTNSGGLTSHAAILARSLNIPAVVGLHNATTIIKNDDLIILDGSHGQVIINPDQNTLEKYNKKITRLQAYGEDLKKLRDEPAITLDGRHVKLMANLDLNEEFHFITENGAEGIGLVRTEQIFQGDDTFPGEEVQTAAYRKLAEMTYPNRVIIRAFDVGGDKMLPVDLKEPNPFLGWRGIRFLLDNPGLLKTQTRAVLRAAVFSNIYFMIPMVSSFREIIAFKSIVNECENELRNEGKEFYEGIKLGIMIEVPSAAVMAKEFAAEVNFVSIGTNDLIQYLLAVDRGNDIISDQYQEFHPSVVRSLAHIIKEAKSNEQSFVSICGEMAADPLAVPLLVGLGLDSLSVSASAIPNIKKIIRSLKYSETIELASKCLECKREKEIRDEMRRFFMEKFPDIFEELFST